MLAPRRLGSAHNRRRLAAPPTVANAVTQLETVGAAIGHGALLFTTFYFTLNWLGYRSMRLSGEKEKKTKK